LRKDDKKEYSGLEERCWADISS